MRKFKMIEKGLGTTEFLLQWILIWDSGGCLRKKIGLKDQIRGLIEIAAKTKSKTHICWTKRCEGYSTGLYE